MVKEKFGKTSKSLKILWPWLSEKFPFCFFLSLLIIIMLPNDNDNVNDNDNDNAS